MSWHHSTKRRYKPNMLKLMRLIPSRHWLHIWVACTDKTKLLKVNIWLTDITTIAEMNSVWDRWAVAGKTPASGSASGVQ